jgi:hypothetical protein
MVFYVYNVNVKHVIMNKKIENILRKINQGELLFNEGHNKLCDLHNVMLIDRNKWRALAWVLIGIKTIEVVIKYTL